MKAVWILATVAVAGVLGGGASIARDAAARQSDEPCKPQFGHKPQVGNLQKIIEDKVYRGKTRLLKHSAPLFTNSTLCTDSDGEVRFVVRRLKTTTCEMYRDAKVRLYPPKLNQSHRQSIIRFENGITYCGTGNDHTAVDDKYDARHGTQRLLMSDPLFAVDVNTRRTVVRVRLGYIEVSRSIGGGAVIVGPQQQVTVPAAGPPGRVVPLVGSVLDARFDRLAPLVPKPDFRPPDARGSSALERIFRQRAITVALAVDRVRDRGADIFTKGFFDFVASSWNIKSDLLQRRTPTWVEELEAERADVVLTSDLKPLESSSARFDFFPLFVDRTETVWHAVLLEDEVFLRALRRFVQQAVTSGDYARIYTGSFARQPSYGPLRPVLFD